MKKAVRRYRPRTDWAVHPSFPCSVPAEKGAELRCPSGEVCPPHLVDIFSDEILQQTGTLIRSYVSLMKRIRGTWNPFIQPLIIEMLEHLEDLFRGTIPWGLCSACQGTGRAEAIGCVHCMSTGYIPLALREYHI